MSLNVTETHMSLRFYPFVFDFNKIGLNESLKKHVKEGEELVNDEALKILKSISIQLKLTSVLTKPVVLLLIGVTVTVALLLIGITVAAAGVVLSLSPPLYYLGFLVQIIGFGILGIGIGILGFSLTITKRGELQKISEGFHKESQLADEYIEKLEADSSRSLSLPLGNCQDSIKTIASTRH